MKNPQHAWVATILILAMYMASYAIALKPVRVTTSSPWASGPPEPNYIVFGIGNSSRGQTALAHFYAPLNAIDQKYLRPAYWEINRK